MASPSTDALLAHAGWVRRLARELVHGSDRVDDVVQDMWVAALERRAEPERPRAWLRGVLANVVRQGRRAESRRAERERIAAAPEPLPAPSDLLAQAELARRVAEAVLELDEPYRSTLLLRFFDECEPAEIARRAGLPASTVRNRLRRGLALLRERFEREQGDRHWALAFAPLLAPTSSTPPSMPPSTPPPIAQGASAPASGGFLMTTLTTHPILAPLLLVGLAVGGFSTLVIAGAPWTRGGRVLETSASAPPGRANLAAVSGERTPVQEPTRRPVESAPQERALIAGTVSDESGAALACAEVFVGGQPSPFAGAPEICLPLAGGRSVGIDDPGALAEWAAVPLEVLKEERRVLGRRLVTDAAGRFEIPWPPAAPGARVYVAVMRTTGIDAGQSGRWLEAPNDALDLRAKRIATANLVLSVRGPGGEQLQRFDARLVLATAGWEHTFEVRGPELARRIELPSGADTLRIAITEPRWAALTEEVRLEPARDARVSLALALSEPFRGRVVDAFGAPLADALVYWGSTLEMRGGYPLEAYSPEHVPDAVLTAADGGFELFGVWRELTVYHAEHSPATVPVEAAALVRLAPRGSVRGRSVPAASGSDGPLAGRAVVLDGQRRTSTDAEGRYVFEGVEAGVHSLCVEDDSYRGITVVAGEALLVPETPPLRRVKVRLLAGGAPYLQRIGGIVMGGGTYFDVHEFSSEEASFALENVVPGEQVLMTEHGHLARFEVQADHMVLDLGTADLAVQAGEETRVFLAPPGATPFVAFWAERLARTPGEDGHVRFGPLVPGRYDLGVAGLGIVKTIAVPGPGTVLGLD